MTKPDNTQLVERIKERMDAVGTNPSRLSIDAGLGRSSVKDILTGRVKSPRIDTIKRLAGKLNCSAEYLVVGAVAVPNLYEDFRRTQPDLNVALDGSDEATVKQAALEAQVSRMSSAIDEIFCIAQEAARNADGASLAIWRLVIRQVNLGRGK